MLSVFFSQTFVTLKVLESEVKLPTQTKLTNLTDIAYQSQVCAQPKVSEALSPDGADDEQIAQQSDMTAPTAVTSQTTQQQTITLQAQTFEQKTPAAEELTNATDEVKANLVIVHAQDQTNKDDAFNVTLFYEPPVDEPPLPSMVWSFNIINQTYSNCV